MYLCPIKNEIANEMKNSIQLKAEIDKIVMQIKDLQLQEREISVQYMRALEYESGFVLGEKVALYETDSQGIDRFVDYGIYAGLTRIHGRIEPRVWKIKKDGTASKNQWSNYQFSKVKKVEQSQQ